MVGKAEEGYSNHSPTHNPTITPMTYKAVIIPQPAVAYLIGALGVKKSGSLFSD